MNKKNRLKLLGIIHAYNEEDCIENAIKCLLNSKHAVHVFDHGSTDNTAKIIKSFKDVTYHYLDRDKIPFSKRNSNKDLFAIISQFINKQAKQFDWVTWLDADEILLPPKNFNALEDAIQAEHDRGMGVIRGTIHEYWITEEDDETIKDYLTRLKYYRVRRPSTAHGINRSWQINLTGNKIPRGKHRSKWKKPISNWVYILKHYPIRSLEQGKKKILKERNWEENRKGAHYKEYKQNKCANLYKNFRNLEKHE
jgi:glycosyltransferase involved in cell wall biosynthesis